MNAPRHSDRFAGRKTKRVDPTAFRVIVQQQAEIAALKSTVADQTATIEALENRLLEAEAK